MTKRQKRTTYHLNVTEQQMKQLQSLIKFERQRIHNEKLGSDMRAVEPGALVNLQTAVDRSIYFHDKHSGINE